MKAINLNHDDLLETIPYDQLVAILYKLDWNGDWENDDNGKMTSQEAISYILGYLNEDDTSMYYWLGGKYLVRYDYSNESFVFNHGNHSSSFYSCKNIDDMELFLTSNQSSYLFV